MRRRFALSLALSVVLPAPAAAQLQPAPPVLGWNPAASYVTAGQDEPGYRSWYMAVPHRATEVRAFNTYLGTYGVAGVIPTWQLLRTATSWRNCGAQPFEVPPTTEWGNMVHTLRYVRDYVVPAIGAVEAVSAYRNPALNVCAGGAPESAHKHYSAIDMVPLRPITREALMTRLCGNHSAHGQSYRAGLGFYAFIRFHVDSTKFRRWNMDPAVAARCPPLVAPQDIANVGQPVPTTPAPTPAPLVPPATGPVVGPVVGPVLAPTEAPAPAPPNSGTQ